MPKVSEIAKATGIKEEKILGYLRTSETYKGRITQNLMGAATIDAEADEVIAFVKSADAAKKALEEAERAERAQAEAERIKAEQILNAEVANVLITSGYSFEGYKITKYSGYISGDDATFVELPTFTDLPDKLKDKLLDAYARIRSQSLRELKEAACGLGCNAVIGLDFDYMITDLPANVGMNYPFVLSVTANGTAVTIEKID